jgi:hypothetical protein
MPKSGIRAEGYERRAMSAAGSPKPADHMSPWDANPTGPFRFCKLQNLECQTCRECQEGRGALPAIAPDLCVAHQLFAQNA